MKTENMHFLDIGKSNADIVRELNNKEVLEYYENLVSESSQAEESARPRSKGSKEKPNS
jgi:hypothetical protein